MRGRPRWRRWRRWRRLAAAAEATRHLPPRMAACLAPPAIGPPTLFGQSSVSRLPTRQTGVVGGWRLATMGIDVSSCSAHAAPACVPASFRVAASTPPAHRALARFEREVLGGRLWHPACQAASQDIGDTIPLSFASGAWVGDGGQAGRQAACQAGGRHVQPGMRGTWRSQRPAAGAGGEHPVSAVSSRRRPPPPPFPPPRSPWTCCS